MNRNYIKKKVLTFIICLLCLGMTGCLNKSEAVSNDNIVNESQQKSDLPENTEKSEACKENIRSSIKKYTWLSDNSEKLLEFADYIIENYDVKKVSDALDNANADAVQNSTGSSGTDGNDKEYRNNVSRCFYEAAGKSLYVLWDEYQGYLKDDKTAQEHQIYMKKSQTDTGNTGDVNISFAGDICLTEDGFVIDHYDEVNGDLSKCISSDIIKKTSSADIFMLNHEYTVSTRGTPLKGKKYTFRATPEREKILKELGTDIVSIANNHIYDYGAEAFSDTMDALKKEQIPYVGAGANINEARKPVYFEVNGMKIGIVSANRSEKVIYTPEAGENTPGVVRMYDTEMMKEIISCASKECDYVIAYVHWGTEDSAKYESYQTDIAKDFVECGADAIIGGHPHVLQGMEFINGKPVVYSLGDFWFNSETKYTTVVSLTVNMQGLQKMSLLPCMQENYTTHTLEGDKADEFYKYIQKLSPKVTIGNDGIVSEH